jgi:hypothetical protein
MERSSSEGGNLRKKRKEKKETVRMNCISILSKRIALFFLYNLKSFIKVMIHHR